MKFEWDPKKATLNRKKHGISFHEAATVFGDPLAMTFDDPDHAEEIRYLTFGHSNTQKLLIISHTAQQNTIRIISARVTTRNERKNYEED